jgi:cell division protein FtsL
MDLQEPIARVARSNEETRKFIEESHKQAAEARKLEAENRKLQAEALKLGRDRDLAIWQVAIGAMAAGAALTGAGAALTKLLWP